MTQSDSSDFEFDVSDLEVEGNEPSASEPRTAASEANADPDQVDSSEVVEDSEVEENSFSVGSSDGDDSELSGFDLDGLPDPFSSSPAVQVEAVEAGDSSQAEPGETAGESSDEAQSARPVESEAASRSMREMGADDLGADVFAEIDDEEEVVSFEDVLEDLMEQVDDFEAGGFVDLDEEAEREAANGEADDEIFEIEDPDDSLSQSVDPNAESPKVARKPEAAESKPRPKLPLDFEIPADPIAEESPEAATAEPVSEGAGESPAQRPASAEAESVESAAPSIAEEVAENRPPDEDDLAGEVVSAYEALEEAEPEELSDVEENLEDERVNVVEESPVLVDEEATDEAVAEEVFTDAEKSADEEVLVDDESGADEESPPSEAETPEPASDEEVEVAEDAAEADAEEALIDPIDDSETGGEEADEVEEDLSQLAEESDEGAEEGDEPDLQALEEEDEEEETLGGADPADAGPGLAILDDDEEEELVEPAAGPEALEESPDESDEILGLDDEDDDIVSMPSADDLLKRAGDILNGGKPSDAASSMLEIIDDDEEELTEMPSPQDLMAEAADPDDEVVAMPDPAEMMKAAADSSAPVSGNVADRAGDLPPPPPAPIEIIDDDPMEEDDVAPEPLAEMEPVVGGELDSPEFSDPFEAEISLDDFDESFGGTDDLADIFPDEASISGAEDGSDPVAVGKGDAAQLVAMPKRGLLWRVTHSIAVAAAVLALAAGWIFTIWKQQIVEYLDGRDIDGSALVMQIRQIGSHALQDFDEHGLYRMKWVDSEVRYLAKNEIRIHALVGAQLRENLYEPVFDSELDEKYGYDETQLVDAVEYARDHYPEEIGHQPSKPWNRLYRMTTPKSEVLPLRVVYRLTREDNESDWALTGVRVRGQEKDEVEWPDGQPAHAFGDHSYDIDSLEFRRLLADYREKTETYVARVSHLRHGADEKLAALQAENQKRRERVMMSLSQGTFFSGVAIVGEDAATAEDVTMVITEIREKGALVKGVFQMDKRTDDYSKFFVGSIDFEQTPNGSEQGVLNLRTVAMSNAPADDTESAFFDPQTVSRMRLKTDGFRLEGDIRDLSLRLTRNM